jgi:hypothetical protein
MARRRAKNRRLEKARLTGSAHGEAVLSAEESVAQDATDPMVSFERAVAIQAWKLAYSVSEMSGGRGTYF